MLQDASGKNQDLLMFCDDLLIDLNCDLDIDLDRNDTLVSPAPSYLNQGTGGFIHTTW